MTSDLARDAWVRLHCAGYSARSLTALLRKFETPQGIVAARPAARNAALPPEAAKSFDAPNVQERVEATLKWLEDPSHRLLAWDDPLYPPGLLQIPDPPPVLYAIGDPSHLARPALAIVGSRHATPRGCMDSEAFAHTLARGGLAIVSGLALGIDAAAHRGALRAAGSTIAVIGTGPDRIYPARNRALAHEIAANGLILSEFVPGTPALKANFPQRNRIISGLARGVLVVEATVSSGSLITARFAAEQGREVFAIPGSIHSPFSRGCHRLIRDGAKLVETAEDVLVELRMIDVSAHTGANVRAASGKSSPRQRASDKEDGRAARATMRAPKELDADAGSVWSALAYELLDVDTLVTRTALPAQRVTAALSTLEIDGRVAALSGGRWQRIG